MGACRRAKHWNWSSGPNRLLPTLYRSVTPFLTNDHQHQHKEWDKAFCGFLINIITGNDSCFKDMTLHRRDR